MKKKSLLQQQAILAAKKQDWSAALQYNQEIIDIDSRDLGALNRLALAQLQLGAQAEAKNLFKQVLEIDKSNVIARKQLDKLKNHQVISVPTFTRNTFIEEPGKTKTVSLHRLASKTTLEKLTVGSPCELKPKNRYISVEIDNQYVGALPEDLSYRLTKLIRQGNHYTCHIRSVESTHCSVFLREEVRSKANEHSNSFPTSKATTAAINELDETFLLEDDIPVQIVSTDHDEDQVFEDASAPAEGGDDDEN